MAVSLLDDGVRGGFQYCAIAILHVKMTGVNSVKMKRYFEYKNDS
jgi:hypothetical protein